MNQNGTDELKQALPLAPAAPVSPPDRQQLVEPSAESAGINAMPEWAERAIRDALRRAARASSAEMASYLQGLFGQKLAAVITGIDDPKTVGRWVRGQAPQEAHAARLRDAFHVAMLLEITESRETARAWFLGMNPDLDDWTPARVIADDPAKGGKRVMQAARNFLAYG